MVRNLTFDSTLTVLVLVATTFAQAPRNTFRNSDGAFEFHYPKSFVLCQPDHERPAIDRDLPASNVPKPQLTGWTPESCSPYMDICPMGLTTTATGQLHPETVACVAYPMSEFEGTNFGGAAFSVGEIRDAPTESDCLQFDQLTTDAKKASWETIGAVKFRANSGAEAGLGHGMSEDIYLTFHNGKCYEVEIRETSTSLANYDPGTIREFKDGEKVSREMKSILHSFRFLR